MSGPAPEPAPGHPEILRLVAPNGGPMTLAGTNTYLVGREPAYVIDPGPDDPGHIGRVREAGERLGGIEGVLLTHAHLDHSAGVEALGAPLLWGAPSSGDEAAAAATAWEALDAAGDRVSPEAIAPDLEPAAGEPSRVGPFEVVPTPGHAPDHVALLAGVVCFCGDLILGEGSSIVPPAAGGGSLRAYMRSLDRLARTGAELLCPGHGPWITNPPERIAEYRAHRLDRERKLRAALAAGERSRRRLLDAAWADVPGPMRPMAALALQAHLEKLVAEGEVDWTESPPAC